MEFVEPLDLAARNAQIASTLNLPWPLIGKPGVPDNREANLAYWSILEAMYRYRYIKKLYGTVPYHRELNQAINDTWTPHTREWSKVVEKFAGLVAETDGPADLSYDEYSLNDLKMEYRRIVVLRNNVAEASEAATMVGGASAAGSAILAGRALTMATGAGAIATGVSVAALGATHFYLDKSEKTVKKILRERVDEGEWSELEFLRFITESDSD